MLTETSLQHVSLFNNDRRIYSWSPGVELGCTYEFSRNTQSWQYWHFVQLSDGNTLKTIKYQILFKANLHLLWHFELKLKSLNSPSNLVSKLSNTKLSTLCITGKFDRRWHSQECVVTRPVC